MFGKRLPYFIALLVIEAIVIVIIVIWTFADTSGGFRSAYDALTGVPVLSGIFNFIWDFAEAISGIIVLAALALVFVSFRKWQRGRATTRLHGWARNGVVVLAQYRKEIDAGDDPVADRYAGAGILIDKLLAKAGLALDDAHRLGGEIDVKVRKTVPGLHTAKEKLPDEDVSFRRPFRPSARLRRHHDPGLRVQ
jgi:hypothetical protein